MTVSYSFRKTGEFVIEDYNQAKPWSSFFPGIAGLYGIPLWAFYVNRGQCMASVGIRSKDEAIMEFLPANKAYQLTPTQGFRTFIKVCCNKAAVLYEPFSPSQTSSGPCKVSNSLVIRPYELELTEVNASLGLRTTVTYFCLPQEPFPALVRVVTVANTSIKPLELTVLDGLSVLVPYGINNFFLKEMSRTIEAWMTVENLESGIPLYRLRTDPRDTAQVSFVKGAHFYMGFEKGKSVRSNRIIADPQCVFGQETDLIRPLKFEQSNSFPARQAASNKMPCAFSYLRLRLDKGEERTHMSLVGHIFDDADAAKLSRMDADFIYRKRNENRALIESISDSIFTASGQPVLDQYARQTYLDNCLRGGLPHTVDLPDGRKSAVYVFSRKHGDLERDYNRFMVSSTFFSEGEGNYRDVNQNRRSDLFFNPLVGDQNVRDFMDLIQLDGYNPLIFKGRKYTIPQDDFLKSELGQSFHDKDSRKLAHIFSKPFSLGEALHYIQDNRIVLSRPLKDVVSGLLELAAPSVEAVFGEGYWSDHWTYNTDLLESFYGIYPERFKDLLLNDRAFTYFDPAVFIKPRSERYSIHRGEVRQYHSLGADEEKAQLIQKRHEHKNQARWRNGEGALLKTTLIDKLICLVANKLSSLDPYGTGIEMEADKPNWYDALNGLPGLLGSSLSETCELKRLVLFLKKVFQELRVGEKQDILLVPEVRAFMGELKAILEKDLPDPLFWDRSQSAKEAYRARVRRGSGAEELESIPSRELSVFFDLVLKKLDAAIAKGYDEKTGAFTTYFSYAGLKHESFTDPLGKNHVVVKEFSQRRLPLFLEGFVHALRTEKTRALEIYRAVKRSALRDKKLGMYKVNASLENESYEIGRARAFVPGWLENGSIWLHMEYKFLLELLKNGLYDDFYENFFEATVPFQKPAVYGRSILENSSFIASSSHPDSSVHGQGFVARLSGSTAEFIQMWLLMNAGERPFFLDDAHRLCLRLKPALSEILFTKKARKESYRDALGQLREVFVPASAYAFLFLGKTLVTYLNPRRRDTFGKGGVSVVRLRLYDEKGLVHETKGDVLPLPFSLQVREGRIQKIEADLE
ncbi:MAG: hypothetical protein WC732_02715 [Candidatus Omnitrophota bacterium]